MVVLTREVIVSILPNASFSLRSLRSVRLSCSSKVHVTSPFWQRSVCGINLLVEHFCLKSTPSQGRYILRCMTMIACDDLNCN